MKKFFVLALGVVLCFGFAATASAIDTDSLESKTTEGLFDRNDAFDLARDAALLYQVEPLHLWTVGSGYSEPNHMDAESESFLVGIARKLGPGSAAIFFETNNNAYEELMTWNEWFQEEISSLETQGYGGWNYYIDPANEYPNYDGVDDFIAKWGDWTRYNWERTEYNWAFAYSMDINDRLAVGLSYEPQFITEEETIDFDGEGIALDGDLRPWVNPVNMFLQNGAWFFAGGYMSVPSCWLGSDDAPIALGSNYGFSYSTTFYFDVEHSAWETESFSSAFEGKRDTDRDVHPFGIRTHVKPSDKWDLVAGLGYATIDQKDRVTGTYTGSGTWHFEDTGESGSPSDYGPWDTAEMTVTQDFTFTLNGALRDYHNPIYYYGPQHSDGGLEEDYDGNRWNVYVSPTYFLNDMHSLRLDLGYGTGSGDFNGGLLGRLDYTRTFVSDMNGEEVVPGDYEYDMTMQGYDIYNNTSSGDYETMNYFVEPRWYVNFDKVRFSAGLGWYYSEDEWDGLRLLNKTSHYTVTEENPRADLDYTFDGMWTGRQYFKGETTETTWRAPVAVEFDITEKLTARVGAAYYRTTVEEKRSDSQYIRENEQWEVRDANGVLTDVGFKEYYAQDPSGELGTPYDQVDWGCGLETKVKETYDYTTYNLGLGYYFTENLQFDLMFQGYSGWVDSSTLYGSFTIMFP